MPPAPTMPMMVAERVFELDEVEHLAGDNRQDLGQQSEADLVQRAAAGSAHALDRLAVGGLDRFGEQLAECTEIRGRDRQYAGKRAEADDVDPHKRPDQGVDAADRIEEAASRKAQQCRGDQVTSGQQAERQRKYGRKCCAEQRDRQRLAHR